MSRPSIKTTDHFVHFRVPENALRQALTEAAKQLANSDRAIQYAVKLASESEAGGITDATYEAFRNSLGLPFGLSFLLTYAEAGAFADELVETLDPNRFNEPEPNVAPSSGSMNVTLGEKGFNVTVGGATK